MRRMARAISPLLMIAASGATAAPSAIDLHDYALAACLTRQAASRELQTEGYRLADIVLVRTGTSPIALKSLDTAVGAALAKHPILMVHLEGPVAESTQSAPLASCLRVIEDRSVRDMVRRLMGARKP